VNFVLMVITVNSVGLWEKVATHKEYPYKYLH